MRGDAKRRREAQPLTPALSPQAGRGGTRFAAAVLRPFSPLAGRRWRAAPDEGRRQATPSRRSPSPRPSPRKRGEGERASPRLSFVPSPRSRGEGGAKRRMRANANRRRCGARPSPPPSPRQSPGQARGGRGGRFASAFAAARASQAAIWRPIRRRTSSSSAVRLKRSSAPTRWNRSCR